MGDGGGGGGRKDGHLSFVWMVALMLQGYKVKRRLHRSSSSVIFPFSFSLVPFCEKNKNVFFWCGGGGVFHK